MRRIGVLGLSVAMDEDSFPLEPLDLPSPWNGAEEYEDLGDQILLGLTVQRFVL